MTGLYDGFGRLKYLATTKEKRMKSKPLPTEKQIREKCEQIKALKKAGHNLKQVAASMHISTATMYKYIAQGKELEFKAKPVKAAPRPYDPMADLKKRQAAAGYKPVWGKQ
jgi:IS30 family transposase